MFDYFSIAIFVASALIMSFIHARYSVIEELRRPWTFWERVSESPRLLNTFVIFILSSLVGAFVLLNGSPFIDLQTAAPERWKSLTEVDNLMRVWKVNGWTHLEGAGRTIGYFSSSLDELLTIFVSAMSFDTINFDTSSAILVLITVFLRGFSGYLLAAKAFNPSVGLLTGALVIFATNNGIVASHDWAFDCSISLFVMALSYMKDLWTSPDQKTLFAYCTLSTIALFLHPACLALLAIVSLTSFLGYVFTQQVSFSILRRSLLRYTIAIALILITSSAFILPLISHSQGANDSAFIWQEVSKIGSLLFKLNLYNDQFKVVSIFGLASLIFLLLSNKFWPFFISSTCLFSFVLFSSDLFEWLPFLNEVPFLREIRIHDLRNFTQILFLSAASFLLIKLIRSLFPITDLIKIESNRLKSFIRIVLVSGVVVLLGNNAFNLDGLSKSDTKNEKVDSDLTKSEAWLKRNSKVTKGYPHRIAIWPLTSKSQLTNLNVTKSTPIYLMSRRSKHQFRDIPFSTNSKLLTHINTRYIVTEKRRMTKSLYRLKKTYGRYRIYENRKWIKGKPYRNIRGSGKLNKIRFSDEGISFSASKNSNGKAMFFVSHFPSWKLTVDGVEQPLESSSYLGIPNTNFMTFDLKPGDYVLKFQDSWQELTGKILSIFGVFLLLLISVFKKVAFRIL